MTLPRYVGRFVVERELGTGSFSTVALAWDEELESPVAIKILHAKYAEDHPEIAEHFVEEARIARRIRSYSVINIHDIGRLPDGRPYLVMEYADLGTLKDCVEAATGRTTNGILSHATISRLVDALAGGVSAIHRAGVVHRDLKPDNVLRQSIGRPMRWPGRSGTPEALGTDVEPANRARHVAGRASNSTDPSLERFLIADLGIAEDVLRRGTSPSLVGGTRGYRAPEQFDPAAKVDPRADVFGATAVLWYALTGAAPPPGEVAKSGAQLDAAWFPLMEAGLADNPADRMDSIEDWRDSALKCLEEAGPAGPEARPAPAVSDRARKHVCPYLGLKAFERQDADRFFGREKLVEEIMAMLRRRSVVVVGGPSGSGKSSLVRAGLAAALVEGQIAGSETWQIEVFTPGRDAIAELYARLARLGESAFSLDDFVGRPGLSRLIGAASGGGVPCLLIIDQFEEVFTLNPREDLERFVEALAALTDPADSRYRILLTIRSDFYSNCAAVPWLADWISRSQLLVGRMTPAELRRAILEPALALGYRLEPSLVDAIVDEARDEAGSLPLVSHALAETWARRDGDTLTLEDYRAAGGVAGAISQTADEVFDGKLTPPEQDAAKQLLLSLVVPGEGTLDTRRILGRDEVQRLGPTATMRRVVSVLTQARLLMVDDEKIQITHEALIASWPRLKNWIDQSREDLRTRLRLRQLAEEWVASGRDEEMLLRHGRLSGAHEWSQNSPLPDESLEKELLDASLAARTRRRRQMRRVQIAVVAGLSVLAIGASAASLIAFRALDDVEEQRTIAMNALGVANQRLVNLLSSGALEYKDSDPLLSAAMAAEAIHRLGNDPVAFDAKVALFAARDNLSRPGPVPLGGPVYVGDALSSALSEDGALVAVGRRDGHLLLVDTASRLIVDDTLATPSGGIEDVRFDTSTTRLFAVSNAGDVLSWPVSDQSLGHVSQISPLPDVVWRADVSGDGSMLTTASEDGTLRLFDLRNAASSGQVIAHRTGDYTSVAFSRDASAIVAGNGSGEVAAWQVPSGTTLFGPLRDVHTSDVWGLEFNSRGDRIATMSSDGTSFLIGFPDGNEIGRNFSVEGISAVTFVPHTNRLLGGTARGDLVEWDIDARENVAASAVGHRGRVIDLETDGRLVVSLGLDQNLRFWQLSDGPPLRRAFAVSGAQAIGVALGKDLLVTGDDRGEVLVFRREADLETAWRRFSHDDAVWATAVSPDGFLAASGDRDGKVKVHDLRSGTTVANLDAHRGSVWSVGFMPDGGLFSAGADGVRLWDGETWGETAFLTLPAVKFERADLSPDGRLLAASTRGGEVVLWHLNNPEQPTRLTVDDNTIWSVRFSHDGTQMAAASGDEVVSIWEVATGERVAEFAGHFGGATDVVFLGGDGTLVASDRLGSLHFWDLPTGQRIRQVKVAEGQPIWRLDQNGEGAVFASSQENGWVMLWDVLSLERACELARGSFVAASRRLYLGNEDAETVCD